MSSQISCSYRQNVRPGYDIEVADCQLLCQITGISGGPHAVVRQDACAACNRASPPSPSSLNPAMASMLHRACERIIAANGVPGCDMPKAERLKRWAYQSIPFVPTRSNPLGLWRGFHEVTCSHHQDDAETSQAPCIHLTRSISSVIGQGFHRSGWPYAMKSLVPLFCREGILFDDFIEQRFCYGTERQIYTSPWVGVFHHPAHVPQFVNENYAMDRILEGAAWKESEKYLRGAIALSEELAHFLSSRLRVPVVVVKHPCEVPEQTWSEEAYLRNPSKKLIQLGWFLRNTRAIYQLPQLRDHEKFRCLSDKPWIQEHDKQVAAYWESARTRTEFGNVTELGYVPHEEYDCLLASNVILTELLGASATNVVIDCIARNTPLIVNRHSAAAEYLTPEYPLFFDDLDEVPALLATERILSGHRYLRGMKKDWITGESFCNSIRDALMTMDLSRPSRATSTNIEGWYDLRFNDILQQIDRQQVSGHVAEIGVHHGKSFFHICKLARPNELALAVDCFDQQHHNSSQSGNGNKQIFMRHVRDLKRVRILDGNSLDFTCREYMAAVGGRFRIFHIDGGHDFETTLHDLTQAAAALTDDGVLIVDDVFNPDWPSVSQALYQFLAVSDLKPFAIAYNKVCLSRRPYFLRSFSYVKPWLGSQVQIISPLEKTVPDTRRDSDVQWHHDLGNDRWIHSVTGGKRGGYFVEAGALDGIAASATYALERSFGWKGICVEPNSTLFPKLVANRTAICEMRCLAETVGEFDFLEIHDGSIGYSGIRDDLVEAKREFWSVGVLTRKPSIGLAQMLKEHNAPRVIDYLALDTEGSEKRILESFDFDEYKFRAISIEGDACTEILTAAGYTEVRNPFCQVDYEHYYLLNCPPEL